MHQVYDEIYAEGLRVKGCHETNRILDGILCSLLMYCCLSVLWHECTFDQKRYSYLHLEM